MSVKLTDLNPRFIGGGGEGVYNADGTPAVERNGVGLMFDCPCAQCSGQRTGDEDKDFHLRHFVGFSNPLDGGPAFDAGGPKWNRTGDTFEALTLTPSILDKGRCGWHGFVTNGEVITV